MEDRTLLSCFTVNNPTDTPVDGETDLRQAIALANSTEGANTVDFDSTVFNTPQTITLNGSQLELSNTTGTETITGLAAGVTVSGGGLSQVFQVDGGVTASISGLTISGGSTTGDGGGIDNAGTLTLTNSTVSNNSAANGGGIENAGTLTLADSTVADNSADAGGGIVNNATMTLTNSTIASNSATIGGGLLNDGTLTSVNSTIAGNNVGRFGSGGGLDAYAGTATLFNTIIALNTRGSGGTAKADDISLYGGGSVSSASQNNLIGTGGSGGLINGIDGNIVLSTLTGIGLAPSGSYGGPTQTIALLPGSPAIDAGLDSAAPATDQRGLPRVGTADIGAVESQGFTLTVVDGSTPQQTPVNTAFGNPLAVIVTANNPVEPVDGGIVTFAAPEGPVASADLSATSAVIASGVAGVTATANGTPGLYEVLAAAGAAQARFNLGNTELPSLVVTTIDDIVDPYDGQTSLREAINYASSHPGADTITFDSMVFGTRQTIALTSGLALTDTTGSTTIAGFGADLLTVTGGGPSSNFSVFTIGDGVTASLSGLTVSGGNATEGGGLFNSGNVTLTNATIASNSADVGGGIFNDSDGTLALTGATITSNAAVDLSDGGGGIRNAGTLTVTNSTISNNSALGGGGGIENSGNLTLITSTIASNSVGVLLEVVAAGGGIENSGRLSITDSSITGNSAFTMGGGIANSGWMMLTASTISENWTNGFGPGPDPGSGWIPLRGNGFGHGGGIANGGTLIAFNSTIADNNAGVGGGIESYGTLTVMSCTVADNAGDGGGGGGIVGGGGISLYDTIIALNTTRGMPADLWASVNPQSCSNLIGIGGSGNLSPFCNLLDVANPGLGALANNGGPTQTIALLPHSPAIDAGSNSILGVAIPTTDQRGALRGPAGLNAGTTVDIGAYEASSSYLVTTAADSLDVGTLRTAVGWENLSTNANPANIANPAPNTIVFDTAGVFATPQTVALSPSLGALELFNPITAESIDGPGASIVTVSGNSAGPVLTIAPGVTAFFSGLTLTGGSAFQGGGIDNEIGATMTVTDSTIEDNSADYAGGGINNDGTMTVTDSTMQNNSTSYDTLGGGINNNGTMTVTNSTIRDNSVGIVSLGGGIYNIGTMTVTNSTIAGNSAAGTSFKGGGIDNGLGGTMTVTSSTIKDNLADYEGGGINNDGTMTVTDSTIQNNSTSYDSSGGGINNYGTMTVTSSTIRDNSVGILSFGGGISNIGTMTVANSTIARNSAIRTSFGGGIANDGVLQVINSTIANNSLLGIFTDNRRLTLINSTIAYNGIGLDVAGGTVTLNNTIVALNGIDDIDFHNQFWYGPGGTIDPSSADNLIGTVPIGTFPSGNGNQVGVANPGLGTLADNGGPTQTIALEDGSPAINAGSNALAVDPSGNPLLYDQRGPGFPRFAGGIVSIGAYQANVAAPTPTTVYCNDAWAGDPLFTPVIWNDHSVHVIGYDAFSSIQPGVNAVATGGTVNVAAGTYTETVTINHDLVLDGAAANLVTIVGPPIARFDFGVTVLTVDPSVMAYVSGLTITGGAAGIGGGIFNEGGLTVTACAITRNGAADYYVGGGPTNFSAGAGVANEGSMDVIDSTIAGNAAGDASGGGIFNAGYMTVTGSTIAGNSTDGGQGGRGGGILNEGIMTVTNSTVAGNSASDSGLYVSGSGGGIDNEASGTLTVTSSTIADNSGSLGGGILNEGIMTFTNSTIAGNSAVYRGWHAPGWGGGIDNEPSGTLTVTNSTFADNSGSLGGGISVDGGAVTLNNTIVARNTLFLPIRPPGVPPIASDIAGLVNTSNSYNNLIGTGGSGGLTNGVNGNQAGIANPGLGTLADNRGPTQTIALLPGSPAIDAGNNLLAVDAQGNPLTTDQRGFPRIVNGTVDIGAFEILQGPPPRVTSISAVTPNPRNSAVSTIDVTFSVPINLSSFDYNDLSLTLDGGTNLITPAVTVSFVSGSTYQIGGLAGLTTSEGNYTLTVSTLGIQDQHFEYGAGSLSTSWLMDVSPPTSDVINLVGTSQSSDSFPVSVSFSDPIGPGGAPASGVTSVDLYDSVDNGPFTPYQTQTLASPTASGTVTFTFVGQDRNLFAFHSVAHDAAGNTESKNSNTIEATTSVPDLNPPVTHILASNPSYSWGQFPSSEFSGLSPSSYNNGVFSINWAGADPDQNTGVPAGSIALVNLYVQVDGGAPVLIGQPTGGTPNGTGVYSGSITYNALADGLPHSYSFYSVGVDDLQMKQYTPQAGPAAPDVTFTETYAAPLASQNLVVEKNIAERSYIRYLDVNFNQTAVSSTALQALAAGLAGTSRNSFVELLWYGENLTSSSTPQGSVNLFNNGTTASVSLTGNDLSINLGANGITSLLTETRVSGTGSPTSSFGDGWYALGIDPNGNPSKGQVFWVPFFRLLGDTNGDGVVTGPYTAAGTDAYTVYHAEGQAGSLLNADVNGDGTVNSKDLTETVAANGHAVGTTPPQKFPQFQLFAGPAGRAGTGAVAVTQTQVQALLPEAIAAWQAAGLDPADLRRLESVQVQVGNLGTSILGLKAANVITINQTAAGNKWYVNASASSSQAFSLAGPGGEKLAGPGSPAVGEVDLLTVLEHEMGHVIGLSDNAQAGDLMDTTLGLGARRAPTAADLATIVPAASIAVKSSPADAAVRGLRSDRPWAREKRNQFRSTHVQRWQPSSLDGRVSVPSAVVDAALASISSAVTRNDKARDRSLNVGSPARSALRISAIVLRPGDKYQTPQSALS